MSVDVRPLIARINALIERELTVVETALAAEDAPKPGTAERERAARSLAGLAKLLTGMAQVGALADEAAAPGEEEPFRDLEEFRRELTRRLAALREAGVPE